MLSCFAELVNEPFGQSNIMHRKLDFLISAQTSQEVIEYEWMIFKLWFLYGQNYAWKACFFCRKIQRLERHKYSQITLKEAMF